MPVNCEYFGADSAMSEDKSGGGADGGSVSHRDELVDVLCREIQTHPSVWAAKRAVRELITRPRLAQLEPAKAVRRVLQEAAMPERTGSDGHPLASGSASGGAGGLGASGGATAGAMGTGLPSLPPEGNDTLGGIGVATVVRNLVAQLCSSGPAVSEPLRAELQRLQLPTSKSRSRAAAAEASRTLDSALRTIDTEGGDESPSPSARPRERPRSSTTPTEDATDAADGPPLPRIDEPLESVGLARREWDAFLCRRMNARCTSVERPLCRPRETVLDNYMEPVSAAGPPASAPPPASAAKDGYASDEEAAPSWLAGMATPVYSNTELLNAVSAIKSPNHAVSRPGMRGWGMISVQLRCLEVEEMRDVFSDLSPEFRQVGVDDLLPGCEWFAERRMKMAQRALENGYVPLLRQICRRGCPVSLRPAVWTRALGAEVDAKAVRYVELLLRDVGQREFVIDEMVGVDVTLTCDDDKYFPFADMLRTVTLAFMRDPWVASESVYLPHCPMVGVDSTGKPAGMAPPSGVLPFAGLVAYSAPLCYVFREREPIFFLFRAMWARYWCRLNTMSSAPGTLIPLCRLFEELAQRYAPETCFHLLQLGIAPLSLAFPWIRFGFATYLETDQVLQLWDRLVGFERLELLPILAAAVFVFRSQSLLRAQSPSDVRELLADASKLRVMPLLQYFLFATPSV